MNLINTEHSSTSSLEIERTFLAREAPDVTRALKRVTIIDYYFPQDQKTHPRLRLRSSGDKFTATKKLPTKVGDSSVHSETNLDLTREEFVDLVKNNDRYVRKIRYTMVFDGHEAEVDVFEDELDGLILIDFEFVSTEQCNSFKPPSICLADVTQEEFIAGGLLAGKNYSDIEVHLRRFGYESTR